MGKQKALDYMGRKLYMRFKQLLGNMEGGSTE